MLERAARPEPWPRGFAWVEQQLGGTLTRWESQNRRRPAWFLELERANETLPLYWRGARAEFHRDTGPPVRELAGARIEPID
ncbi:MAG: hypothetical protein VX681_06120 [Myxococcota bacterium]|nr:hypothetical protein [Myxococcota bacterium]